MARNSPHSPYPIDQEVDCDAVRFLRGKTVFFDGVFKGDYSLAIVNRNLAKGLVAAGIDVVCHTAETDWQSDILLSTAPAVRSRMRWDYPDRQSFDVHLRNTWPPTTHDMIGRFNAYVCFAWEESELPVRFVDAFNRDLDLIMVTSTFVERAFRHSGVTIPITIVGNGCDHLKSVQPRLTQTPPLSGQSRITHVSSGLPRKGVDLLIEAYITAFRRNDPVELFIKTFSNPDNVIDQTLKRFEEKCRDAAPIKVECASWSNEDILDLYRSSAMVVAPSRGEGFGLPLAEAMMLEIPVVTTGYGGQADFCNDQTAWMVGYTLAPSKSHVAGSFGLWANADVAELAATMRAVIERREIARQRSKAAKHLLATHFTWERVTARVLRSISSTMRATVAQKNGASWTMDLISSWQQQCGIATYAGHLFSTPSLAPHISGVLAKRDLDDSLPAAANISPTPPVSRIWGYDIQALMRLAQQIEVSTADVIWIQHHPGHFSNSDMEIIAGVLQKASYKVRAVTMHNVNEAIKGNPIKWASAFDVIFVHSAEDVASLSTFGLDNVSVIPHGFAPHDDADRTLPSDRFTVGTFGFLTAHKNIDRLILAVRNARRFCPHIHLTLLNAERSSDESRHLRAVIETLIENVGLKDFVSARFDFIPEHELIDQLCACDVLVFPYADSNESATGAARIAMSADRPILCSRSAPLHDLWPISHVLRTDTIECMTEALASLAQNKSLLKVYDPDRRSMIQNYSYTKLASRYANHIEELLLEKTKRKDAA